VLTRLQYFLQSQLATYVVVLYGLGSVLGYGLHEFWDCDHCRIDRVSTSYETVHTNINQNFDFSIEFALTTTDQQSHEHSLILLADPSECALCAFLALAQTPSQTTTLSVFSWDVTAETPVSERISPLFLPSEHLARGPPVC